MRSSLILILLFNWILASAQQKQLVRVILHDVETNEIIQGAHLKIMNGRAGFISNQNGEVIIETQVLPLKIKISHVAYNSIEYTFTKPGIHTIFLYPSTIVLPEFEYSEIQKVVRDETFHIIDYEFYKDKLVVLGYYTRFKQSMILLIDDAGDTISSLSLNTKANELSIDCAGNLLIIIDQEVFILEPEGTGFNQKFLFVISEDELKLPCHLLFENMMITSVFVNNQLLAMGFIRLSDSVFHYFRIIDNQDILFQPENWGIEDQRTKKLNIDYLNRLDGSKIPPDFQNLVIHDKNAWIKDNSFYCSNQFHYDNQYLLDLMYFKHVIDRPVYAPMFQINNKLYIFNHPYSQIEVYNDDLLLENEIQINFHEVKGWENKLIYDSETKKVYTLFESKGKQQLYEINTESGSADFKIEVLKAFASDIRVHGGFLYFLYMEENYLSNEKIVRKLYRQKISA